MCFMVTFSYNYILHPKAHFCCCLFFWDRILCSSGCPQTHWVAEQDLELLVFLPLPDFSQHGGRAGMCVCVSWITDDHCHKGRCFWWLLINLFCSLCSLAYHPTCFLMDKPGAVTEPPRQLTASGAPLALGQNAMVVPRRR